MQLHAFWSCGRVWISCSRVRCSRDGSLVTMLTFHAHLMPARAQARYKDSVARAQARLGNSAAPRAELTEKRRAALETLREKLVSGTSRMQWRQCFAPVLLWFVSNILDPRSRIVSLTGTRRLIDAQITRRALTRRQRWRRPVSLICAVCSVVLAIVSDRTAHFAGSLVGGGSTSTTGGRASAVAAGPAVAAAASVGAHLRVVLRLFGLEAGWLRSITVFAALRMSNCVTLFVARRRNVLSEGVRPGRRD